MMWWSLLFASACAGCTMMDSPAPVEPTPPTPTAREARANRCAAKDYYSCLQIGRDESEDWTQRFTAMVNHCSRSKPRACRVLEQVVTSNPTLGLEELRQRCLYEVTFTEYADCHTLIALAASVGDLSLARDAACRLLGLPQSCALPPYAQPAEVVP